MNHLRRWHIGLLFALGITGLVIGVCSIAGVEIDHRLRLCLAVVQIAAGLGILYTTIRALRGGKDDDHAEA